MMDDCKISLRVKYREIRGNIPNRNKLEDSINEAFLTSELYKKCSSLFMYSAVGSEVRLEKAFERALSDGKRVAFPVCTDFDGNMEFYFVSDKNQLKSGMYGIREPDKDVCEKALSDAASVCLVPGLCFNLNGGRLGYGKGYYDRFLPEFKGITAGICFEDCICESLITEKFDIKTNYLITNKKIYIFR